MISLVEYSPHHKSEWNDFIMTARNGLFLFDRNYMEYHQSRFQDNSLLFYKKGHLIGAFPANIADNTLYSHAGLTFGGIIMDRRLQTDDMVTLFQELLHYAKEQRIGAIRYKAIPSIYHTIPSEEDRYALYLSGGRLIQRDLSSSINFSEPLQVTPARMRKIRQAEKRDLVVCEDSNYREFWDILEDNLQKRYQKKPVHTLDEIQYLRKLFPANIRLFSCYENNQIIAGSVVYESRNVAHTQYNASTERGRQVKALDLIIWHLITRIFPGKRYFDFGISTEAQGRYFNRDLAYFKESFGASAIVHDTYELTV
jgi:hypothetical protein